MQLGAGRWPENLWVVLLRRLSRHDASGVGGFLNSRQVPHWIINRYEGVDWIRDLCSRPGVSRMGGVVHSRHVVDHRESMNCPDSTESKTYTTRIGAVNKR